MTTVELASGAARATITLAGAEVRRWSVAGRDLLWPGDPAIWDEISPILYPVVGWTRDGARVGGKQYALGLHGFARFETFGVETSGPDFVRMTLDDSDATRAVYPFAFTLALEYRLTDEALEIAIEVAIQATSPRPTPAGCIRASAGRSARPAATARSSASASRNRTRSRPWRRAD